DGADRRVRHHRRVEHRRRAAPHRGRHGGGRDRADRRAPGGAAANGPEARRLDAAGALNGAQEAGNAKVIIESYPNADAAALRTLADDLRGMTGRFVAVVGGTDDGRPSLLVAASRDLAAEGFDAGEVVRLAAPLM